jgi:hypothetical protein
MMIIIFWEMTPWKPQILLVERPSQNYFQACFQVWQDHMQCCVGAQGNYFEENL